MKQFPMPQREEDELLEREGEVEAQLDELCNDPGQVGPNSAGQAGDPQGLSRIEGVSALSVEALADTDQAVEAAFVEGVEDAADHPERPVHTHNEYGRPETSPSNWEEEAEWPFTFARPHPTAEKSPALSKDLDWF